MVKARFAVGVAALLYSTAIVSSAHAATYTSESSFTAANTVTSGVSFSDVATNIQQVDSPYVKDGVTFTGNVLNVVDTSFWGSVDSLLDNRFNGFIDFTFDPAQAVGFYVAGSYNDAPIGISVYNGSMLLASYTHTAGGVSTAFNFFGVDGLGDITRVRLDSAGVDDGFASVGPISFAAGAGAGVPEPAAWALMIGGFGMVGSTMRRRKVAMKIAFA